MDAIGWRVDLPSPEQESCLGETPEEALAWCLVWLKVEGLGGEPPC